MGRRRRSADDLGMRRTSSLTLAPAALALALLLGACGSSGSDAADPAATDATSGASSDATAGDDVTDALEESVPTDTVEVPSEDGATTIADYAAGGSSYEPADPTELATVLSLIGTDADGYLTDDAIVVRAEEADASLWCATTERLGLSTYQFIPVLPDGTGVACG
jgi:hypothetical protein